MRSSSPGELLKLASQSNRVALAKLLSIVERGGEEARELTRLTFGSANKTYLVGITGAPGAGKSTLVDGLISEVRKRSMEVAVLAIDPSSPFSGGAILGDRVRMSSHASDNGVFIRSMATRGHLGGLALAVPDAVRVLSTVGFPYLFIETVGVGQVEVEIVGAADTTVVVMTPGWGDAVQANKAGLMEVADLFVINKADRAGVRETRRDIEMMLEMSSFESWVPPIVETTASGGIGVDMLFEMVEAHREFLESSGLGLKRREARILDELRRVVQAELMKQVEDTISGSRFKTRTREMLEGKIDPYSLAHELLNFQQDD